MLEVIGAGFGRTGTLSLKRALEILGFDPCYHFRSLLVSRHARQWLAIADSDRPDWSTVFSDYRATTDWPAAAYWRELAAAYPEAKLILTVRDEDDWYDSVRDTIWRLRDVMPGRWPGFRSIAAVADRVIWNGEFDGRADERDFAIARYRNHNEDVQRALPADRLLVFDVRDGWEPLCQFLDVSVPDGVPFPHSNDRQTMRRYIGLISTLRYALPAVTLLALAAAIAAGVAQT